MILFRTSSLGTDDNMEGFLYLGFIRNPVTASQTIEQ